MRISIVSTCIGAQKVSSFMWGKAPYIGANKSFSVYKYGREEAFRLACEVRQREIEKLRLLGFDYTDRHVLAQ